MVSGHRFLATLCLTLLFTLFGSGVLGQDSQTGRTLADATLRASASTQSTALRSLPADTAVTIIGQVQGASVTLRGITSDVWLHVSLSDGQQGYIWSGLVEVVESSNPGVAPTQSPSITNVISQPEMIVSTGSILFVSSRDNDNLDGDLYIVNSDGSGLHRLLTLTGDDRNPIWSPDGNKIAFENDTGNSTAIYVADASGENLHNLTPFKDSRSSEPTWSPDGQYIAYSIYSDNINNPSLAQIYITDSVSQNTIHLEIPETCNASHPSWGSAEFAFAFACDEDVYLLNITTDMIRETIESGKSGSSTSGTVPNLQVEPYLLADFESGSGESFDFAWSPDSQLLAFVFDNTQEQATKLYVSDLEGLLELPTSNTFQEVRSPVWSLENYEVFFYDSGQIWVSDIGGGAVPIANTEGSYGDFTMSPDRQWITYVGNYTEGSGIIHIVNVKGDALGDLPGVNGEGHSPVWQPGSSIGQQPQTGELISNNSFFLNGDGELTIENTQDRDVVIMLTAKESEAWLSFYVRANDNFTLEYIPDGTYNVYVALGRGPQPSLLSDIPVSGLYPFQSGQQLNSREMIFVYDTQPTLGEGFNLYFTRDTAFFRFEEPLLFETSQTRTQTLFTIWTLTLGPTEGGTAETTPVDPSEFPN